MSNRAMNTREYIERRGKYKIYAGSIIQNLISDIYESYGDPDVSFIRAARGIEKLRHAAEYLQRVNEGTL